MANLDTNSVVDYMASQGLDSSLASRKTLGTKYGVDYSKTTDNYASQNTALLTALKGAKTVSTTTKTPTIPNPSTVTDPNGANSFINDGQQNDFNSASSSNGDTPTTKSSTQSYEDMFASLKSSLTPSSTKPADPNYATTYQGLLQTNGINDLESSLTGLKSQAKEIQDANAARHASEEGKSVAMNVIAGRESEEDKQDTIKLNAVNRQIEDTSSQLTTKYNVVNNIMNYSKLDYDSAVNSYDTNFTQNLNMFNTIKGIVETDKNNADKVADNARANLQIVYNNISAGSSDVSSLTANEKANITKLELQAGLPTGFYQSLQLKNPKASILSTTTRDNGGTKYADVIIKNDDGSMSVKSYALGKSDTGGASNADNLSTAISKISPQIQAVRGGDNYVSPENYQKFRDAWSNAGLSADSFDKSFKQYANPESYSKLGISF